jgi:hypothetical protein
MKLQYKFALISTLSAFALAALMSIGNFSYYLLILGILLLCVGTIFFIVALILHGLNNKPWSQAFFLTTAIFMLVGFGVCGSMFLGM